MLRSATTHEKKERTKNNNKKSTRRFLGKEMGLFFCLSLSLHHFFLMVQQLRGKDLPSIFSSRAFLVVRFPFFGE